MDGIVPSLFTSTCVAASNARAQDLNKASAGVKSLQHTSKQYPRAMKCLADFQAKMAAEKEYAILTASAASFAHSDVGNADRLMVKYGSRMAHTAAAGWAVYDGKRWDIAGGETRAMGIAGEVARGVFFECKFLNGDEKAVARRIAWAEKSGRAGSLRVCSTQPRRPCPSPSRHSTHGRICGTPQTGRLIFARAISSRTTPTTC